MENNDLLNNIDKLHTTKLGIGRIKQNLGLETNDVVGWCRNAIRQANDIIRTGKNWYVHTDDCVITVNVNSYTIITAHKIKADEIIVADFSSADLEEAYEALLSMVHKLEKTQDKLKPGSPQMTLLIKRLRSLRLAMYLIKREMK